MGKVPLILGGLGLSSILALGIFLQKEENGGFFFAEQQVKTMESISISGIPSPTGSVSETQPFRNVMYYSDWSIWEGQSNFYPQDLPTHLYTHLNFAFLDFDAAGNLQFTDSDAAVSATLNQEGVIWGDVNAGILPVLRAERAENPNMKLGISVGGWSKSGDFSTMAANDTTRGNFVSNMMKFLEYTDFDFIDLDWEYPGVIRQPDYTDNALDEGTPAASPSDKENYIKLLSELRNAMEEQGKRLGKTYELTVALPMDQDKLSVGIDIPNLFDLVDFANIMTYDGRGAFDSISGHHSPLYGNPKDPYYEKGYSIDQTVKYLLSEGAAAEKIVVGAAFYSRGWENITDTQVVSGLPGLFGTAGTGVTNADQSSSVGAFNELPLTVGDGGLAGGVWAYRNFTNLKASYPNLVEYWDDVAKAPYLYNGSAFFTYDNPQSLTEKANYVRENGLGGIISWQAGNDAVTDTPMQRDLLTKAIYEGLYPDTALLTNNIISAPLDIDVSISTYEEPWSGSGLEITITNLERAEETGSVLREVELQKETIQMGKLYLDCGGISMISGGDGSGTVTQEGNLTVVDLSSVYENKNIAQGQQVTFRLQYSDSSTQADVSHLESMLLTQRVTSDGIEISKQVIYGSDSTLEGGNTQVPSIPETTPTVPENNQNVPEITPSLPEMDNNSGTSGEILPWSREQEALGVYVPGVKVSYKGVIYLQVSQGTLWWEEPSVASSHWEVVGAVEGYIPPEPTIWTREEEALGNYTPGTQVIYQGRTYEQISQSTAWWCEPGTDASVWKEIS